MNLRDQLAELLGGVISDKQWQWLTDYTYVKEWEDGIASTEYVAGKLSELRDTFGEGGLAVVGERRKTRSEPTGRSDPLNRQLALSLAYFYEAAKVPGVIEFREKHMASGPLKLAQMEEWVRQQSKRDGAPTQWLSGVPLPESHHTRRTSESTIDVEPELPVNRAAKSEVLLLRFPSDANDASIGVPVRSGGVLDSLRMLGIELARTFGWSPSQAVYFVITGQVPMVILARARYQRSFPFTSTSKIILTLDPALSPREVAEEYSRARRQIISGRHRELTVKHMQLAVYAARRPTEMTWVQARKHWNGEMPPEWRYSSNTQFARDSKVAYERLLKPNYPAARFQEDQNV